MNRIANLTDNQLWERIESIINACSPRQCLKATAYQNTDETKYFRSPTITNTRNCTVVTLGIGQDVQAELKIKERNDCQFFGADPIDFINSQIYSQVGEYHKIAVGARDGEGDAFVWRQRKYVHEISEFKTLPNFLMSSVQQKIIDLLLVDVEYAEYDMFNYFLAGSEIEGAGIIICQVNIEVHAQQDFMHSIKAADFIRRLLADNHYFFVEASEIIGHRRFYFARTDEVCM